MDKGAARYKIGTDAEGQACLLDPLRNSCSAEISPQAKTEVKAPRKHGDVFPQGSCVGLRRHL